MEAIAGEVGVTTGTTSNRADKWIAGLCILIVFVLPVAGWGGLAAYDAYEKHHDASVSPDFKKAAVYAFELEDSLSIQFDKFDVEYPEIKRAVAAAKAQVQTKADRELYSDIGGIAGLQELIHLDREYAILKRIPSQRLTAGEDESLDKLKTKVAAELRD